MKRLRRAVGVDVEWRRARRARRLLEKPDERGHCPFDDLDIGVEEQDEFPGGAAVRLIDRRREAEVVVVSDQD